MAAICMSCRISLEISEGTKATKERILKAERTADLPTVEELFRVITSNTLTAVIEQSLIQRLERGQVRYHGAQKPRR